MASQPLPTRLKREPLVDAVFEVRFSSSVPASSVLPGFFFAKLGTPQWKVDRLPIADLPNQLRNADPNLRYQPLMRVHWDNYLLLIGDMMLAVGCKMPYPGWTEFKDRIMQISNILKDVNIIQAIERYSHKSSNILEGKNLFDQIQMININVRIGNHIVSNERFTLRVEIPNADFLDIIKIASDAKATMVDGVIREGSLVDIDVICNYEKDNVKNFIEELPDRLDAIHLENKRIFFECLKPETIVLLEPVYG